jgi:hypothetical protein
MSKPSSEIAQKGEITPYLEGNHQLGFGLA